MEGLRKPEELIVIAVTLLAYGCPVQAIVHALGLDERTVVSLEVILSQIGLPYNGRLMHFKQGLALIDIVVPALLRDAYPGHESFRHLFRSTLEALACRLRTLGEHMRHCGQRSVALHLGCRRSCGLCGPLARVTHILTTLA